jgi:hypothetical protein
MARRSDRHESSGGGRRLMQRANAMNDAIEPIPTRISPNVLPMVIAGFERGGCGSPDNATQFRWIA